jgi:hypothetical protein
MGSKIQEVSISKIERYVIYDLIESAGFRVVSTNNAVTLEDTTSREADKYSDLTFKSLVEAVFAIAPYICNQIKLTA